MTKKEDKIKIKKMIFEYVRENGITVPVKGWKQKIYYFCKGQNNTMPCSLTFNRYVDEVLQESFSSIQDQNINTKEAKEDDVRDETLSPIYIASWQQAYYISEHASKTIEPSSLDTKANAFVFVPKNIQELKDIRAAMNEYYSSTAKEIFFGFRSFREKWAQ